MWHEARRQEKKLRGLMVDYKKRAERRRNYYEMIKKDPCSFLRLSGASVKIHIDPSIVAAAEGPRTMMAWNGDSNNLIDRFDVRAHMDYIPDYKSSKNLPDALEVEEDMKCNYERYRIIVQNDCAGIKEEIALRQIEIDEKYGDISKNTEQEEKKKALSGKKAAIGFSYDTNEAASGGSKQSKANESSEEEPEDDFEDVDLDIAFDIDEINSELKEQLDVVATTYGMSVGEFTEQLRKDKEDEQELRAAKLAEEEKAAMSGRKSRRERRMYKETMLRLRGTSPPKYQAPGSAARSSPNYGRGRKSESESSRSPSPIADNLEFITNLGADDSSASKSHDRELPLHLRTGAASLKSSSQSNWKKHKLGRESPDFLSSLEPQSVKVTLEKSPPIKSYRRKSLEKTDSDSSSDNDKSERARSSYRSGSNRLSSSHSELPGLSSSKNSFFSGKKTMTAQERLKRKMQAALNKTYKADKRSAEEKRELARKEQIERAEELRQQVEEIRRKEYRKRHSSSSSRSRSRSPARYSDRRRDRSRSPSRRDSHYESSSGRSRDHGPSSRYGSGDRSSSRSYSKSSSSHSGRRSRSHSPSRRRVY